MLDPGAENLLHHLQAVLPAGPFIDRRVGRAVAFQTLYEVDIAHHAAEAVLERIVPSDQRLRDAAAFPDDVLTSAVAYAREVVQGVLEHRADIDRRIQERAPAYPLSQMSAVDRNVLRVGLYESLYGGAKVPVRAAINEAVELAKLFGSETSAKFVNGVLGRAVEADALASAGSARAGTESTAPSAAQEPATDVSDAGPEPATDAERGQPNNSLTKGGETMAASAEERLKKIIAEQLSVSEEEVTPEANFIEDLNADSLDLVELIMSLEEEFNVKISDEEAEKIRTVQDALDYLHERVGE